MKCAVRSELGLAVVVLVLALRRGVVFYTDLTSPEIPTIHMGVFGWVIFFFILAAALVFFCVNRQKEKRLRRQAWNVTWKLAGAADQWMEAY